MMVKERQELVVQIIAKGEIGKQDVLRHELTKFDVHVSAATVNRDIKDLRLQRIILENGEPRYVLSDDTNFKKIIEELTPLLHRNPEAIPESIELFGMKTAMDHSGIIASLLEKAFPKDIYATIHGRDTILFLMYPRKSVGFIKEIKKIIKE